MPGTDPARQDALPVGTSLCGYTLEAVVGHGRFAIVYRAQHVQPGSTVAIKEYLPIELAVREGAMVWVRNPADNQPYQEGLRRFREEARDLIHFQAHPGVVSCLDCFQANGTAYMVMDYEEGRTLAEVLATREAAGRPFEEADVLGVMVPLLEALQCVHEAGLLHRDLKPSNILIRESDNRPVLIDFGAYKQVAANQSKSMAPCTDGYAALEQVADAGERGPWTDLYGIGAVMWRMVAGRQRQRQLPRPARVEDRLDAVVSGLPDPLSKFTYFDRQRFSRSLLEGIDLCLRLGARRRIQSCRELLGILQAKPTDHEQGSATVQRSRGDNLPDRYGVEEWCRDAAQKGYAVAQYSLGQLYRHGQFGPEGAQYSLGQFSRHGRFIPEVAEEDSDPVQWYRKAAEQGHKKAQYQLGLLYEAGRGVTQNATQAVQWYRWAGQQGDPDAQYRLGDLYFFGSGLARSDVHATEWYRRAAEQGHDDAQCCLASLHLFGGGVAQDYTVAAKWYQEAAKQDHAVAQCVLGDLHHSGSGVEQNLAVGARWYKRAEESVEEEPWVYSFSRSHDRKPWEERLARMAEWYWEGAKRGQPEAEFLLGRLHDLGILVVRDHSVAAGWYRKAAGKGHAGAQFRLGRAYSKGFGLEQDYDVAVEWYQRAAEQGYLAAEYRLGRAYEDGLGIEQNLAVALERYRRAAEVGHAGAQHKLGWAYDKGLGVTQDHSVAAEWYRKSAAQGHAGGECGLGDLYRRGDGVERDPELANELFSRAAEQDHVDAQYFLGMSNDDYHRSFEDEVHLEDFYEDAKRWYRAAAVKGHTEAQYRLAGIYCRAPSWEQEFGPYGEAEHWYREAARQGHAGAEFGLGMLYRDCLGVDEDTAEAAVWFRKAADRGHAGAQHALGKLYSTGDGVERDYKEAVQWNQRAAEQGLPEAQCSLGRAHEKGKGVAQDHSEAAEWYRKAAEQHEADAQYRLGNLYRRGNGVTQDDAKAAYWYRKAAKWGHKAAKKALRLLEDNADSAGRG